MKQLNRFIVLFGCFFLTGLVGCSKPWSDIKNPAYIASLEYDRVFESSLEVLREMQFKIDTRDRRQGLITTQPKTAASIFEPWHYDQTDDDHMAQSTINHERRVVRVMLEPIPIEDQDSLPQVHDPNIELTHYLFVESITERRLSAERTMNTAGVASLQFRHRVGGLRTIRTETGVQGVDWWPVGRDRSFEQRVLYGILQRVSDSVKADLADKPGEMTDIPAPPPTSIKLDDAPTESESEEDATSDESDEPASEAPPATDSSVGLIPEIGG